MDTVHRMEETLKAENPERDQAIDHEVADQGGCQAQQQGEP